MTYFCDFCLSVLTLRPFSVHCF